MLCLYLKFKTGRMSDDTGLAMSIIILKFEQTECTLGTYAKLWFAVMQQCT